MRRFRFSIAGLLGVVLLIAVALAALRASTDTWDSGILGLILLHLLMAVLLAIHGTDRKRAYWLGFALFGWVDLIASFVPPVESRLPTMKLLAYLDARIRPRHWSDDLLMMVDGSNVSRPQTFMATAVSQSGARIVASPPQGPVRLVRVWDTWSGQFQAGPSGTPENFVRIGHSLLALVLASVGGRLSRWLYDKNLVGIVGGDDRPSNERRQP